MSAVYLSRACHRQISRSRNSMRDMASRDPLLLNGLHRHWFRMPRALC